MVAFRHYAVAAAAACLLVASAVISDELDPISSIEAFAVDRNVSLTTSTAAANNTLIASPVAFGDLFPSSFLQSASASRRAQDFGNNVLAWLDSSTKPLTVTHALRIASHYAVTALVIGSIALYCIMFGSWQMLLSCANDDPLELFIQVVGMMVVALIAKYVTKAIWYFFSLVFIRVDADDDFFEHFGDVPEDADDAFAGQDELPVEAETALRNKGRSVSFGIVFTREHSVTVGDHSKITLDWGHAKEYAVPVEQHNNNPRRRLRLFSASEQRTRICTVTGCMLWNVYAAEHDMAQQLSNQELTESTVEADDELAGQDEWSIEFDGVAFLQSTFTDTDQDDMSIEFDGVALLQSTLTDTDQDDMSIEFDGVALLQSTLTDTDQDDMSIEFDGVALLPSTLTDADRERAPARAVGEDQQHDFASFTECRRRSARVALSAPPPAVGEDQQHDFASFTECRRRSARVALSAPAPAVGEDQQQEFESHTARIRRHGRMQNHNRLDNATVTVEADGGLAGQDDASVEVERVSLISSTLTDTDSEHAPARAVAEKQQQEFESHAARIRRHGRMQNHNRLDNATVTVEADGGLAGPDDVSVEVDLSADDADDWVAGQDDVSVDGDLSTDDADDGLAGQEDEPVEAVVAIVMIVAPPLRRSKRVAAQQRKAFRSGVTPNPYASSGLRQSARLAGVSRVNYKY
jgi:hypothetical protein